MCVCVWGVEFKQVVLVRSCCSCFFCWGGGAGWFRIRGICDFGIWCLFEGFRGFEPLAVSLGLEGSNVLGLRV